MSARSTGAFSPTGTPWESAKTAASIDEMLGRLRYSCESADGGMRNAIEELLPLLERLRSSVDQGESAYRSVRFEIRDRAAELLAWIADSAINGLQGDGLEAVFRKVFAGRVRDEPKPAFDVGAADTEEVSATLFELSA